MRSRRNNSIRSVVMVVAILAVGSTAISLYSGCHFHEGNREASAAIAIGLPSAKELAEARAALRKMDAAMDAALLSRMTSASVDMSSWQQQRRALQAHLDAYDKLPSYPGTRLAVERIVEATLELDTTAAKLFAILQGSSLENAHAFENADWRMASDKLDAAIHGAFRLNLEHVLQHAANLGRIARTSLTTIILASFVDLLLAAIALLISARVLRTHDAVLVARAAEWEMFSSRVAHDVMTPLQTIAMSMEIVSGATLDEVTHKAAVRGVAASARLRSTMDALLNFARAGGRATEDGRASVRDAVVALVDELQPEATAQKVELSASAELPAVEVACSPGVLHILLANLVGNAIKYMGERPVRHVEVKVLAGARAARLEVHDTGPGLEPGAEQHIFEPYVRGKERGVSGLGLGLATVKRITEAYGGCVGVRSTRAEGSVFWVEMPTAVPR